MLLHLVLAAEWSRISSSQMYEPPSLTIEGFVHCTGDDETMLAVANRFYAGVDDEFVVLGLDPAALTSAVIWERPAHPDGSPAEPGEPEFPHVYGPLDLAAVSDVRRLVRDGNRRFIGFAPLPHPPTTAA